VASLTRLWRENHEGRPSKSMAGEWSVIIAKETGLRERGFAGVQGKIDRPETWLPAEGAGGGGGGGGGGGAKRATPSAFGSPTFKPRFDPNAKASNVDYHPSGTVVADVGRIVEGKRKELEQGGAMYTHELLLEAVASDGDCIDKINMAISKDNATPYTDHAESLAFLKAHFPR